MRISENFTVLFGIFVFQKFLNVQSFYLVLYFSMHKLLVFSGILFVIMNFVVRDGFKIEIQFELATQRWNIGIYLIYSINLFNLVR